ncbi:hypothetical protein BDK51DRAFT_17278, partial [Blyttiomyces helicus]
STMSADSHKLQGNKFFQEGLLREAIKEYSTAIIKNPSNPVYYTNRARCFYKVKEHRQCISDARRATELDSTSGS